MVEKNKEYLSVWCGLTEGFDRLVLHSINGVTTAFASNGTDGLSPHGTVEQTTLLQIEDLTQYLINTRCHETSHHSWCPSKLLEGKVILSDCEWEVRSEPIAKDGFSLVLQKPVEIEVSEYVKRKKAELDKFESAYRVKSANNQELYPLSRPVLGTLGWETQLRVIGGVQ